MTSIFDTPDEELANFLAGTFHQDVDSSEHALEEYIVIEGKNYIIKIIDCAKGFLMSDRSEQEKTEFIQSNAEIYFPAIGLTPIQWLEHVVQRLQEAVKSK